MLGYRLRDLLPWRSFTIATRLSVDEAATELATKVGRAGWFSDSSDLPFVGEQRGAAEFEIRRAIWYRNSFRPNIHVTMESGARSGAAVHVRMRMHAVAFVFATFWMTGATLAACVTVVASVLHGDPTGLPALLFPLFGVALIGGGFAYEARQAEELVRDIFPPAPPEAADPYR
jgi:hypothetical protein